MYGRGSKNIDNVQKRLFEREEPGRIELVVSETMMMMMVNPERHSC